MGNGTASALNSKPDLASMPNVSRHKLLAIYDRREVAMAGGLERRRCSAF
jgi:hypothetical protein